MQTSEEVKQWLSRFSENERQLDNLIERIEALHSRLETPRSSTISGMPHGGGYESDQIGRTLGIIEDLERQAQSLLAKSRHLYKEIDTAINQINGRTWSDRRCVLKCRYLDGFGWETVCSILFGREPDYYDRFDTYQRRTYKIHAEALEAMLKISPGIGAESE